jgi:hypothetical protein
MSAIGQEGWRPSEVHPLAELFPSLSHDDFIALAEDIQEHGLRYPIIINKAGVLLDGRMRLAACERAGVEPRFELLGDEDPVAFIWSVNGKRRHVTKGQLAMIAASNRWSNSDQRDDAKTDIDTAARQAGVSTTRLKQAGTVVRHAPHLVKQVIDGEVVLDDAYNRARENEREKDRRDEDLKLLREQDKDLAQKVADGEMDLEDARDALETRRKEEHERRMSVLQTLSSILDGVAALENSTALLELRTQLLTEEGREDVRKHFRGGAREIGEKLAAACKVLAAVELTFSQISGSRKSRPA